MLHTAVTLNTKFKNYICRYLELIYVSEQV